MALTDEDRYRIILTRSKQYDDVFFFAVTSTGICCRPSCPAPRPLRRNVQFFRTFHEAERVGFRACKRCHPAEKADRQMQSIKATLQGAALNDRTLETAAAQLAISGRQLRRTVQAATGTSPVQFKQSQRLMQAAALLQQTGLPVAQVAFEAGFGSIRQCNRAFKAAYGLTPSAFRQASHPAPPTASPCTATTARITSV